jgi:endonuclease YncB( thermonuclease family)
MQSKLFLFFMPLLALSFPLEPQEISAKCLKVLDGDTIIVSRGDREIKVRLAFIDAPEVKQLSLYTGNAI